LEPDSYRIRQCSQGSPANIPVLLLPVLLPGRECLVDLFHAALNGDAVCLPWVDVLVLMAVILVFIWWAKVIQKRNLVKGI
jgi:hypothetical protein